VTSTTDTVSRFVADAATAPFDDEIRELARRHVLDTLASIVACRDLEPAQVARRYALANSAHPSGAAILGTNDRVSLVDAVFSSAMAGHGAEINDFMPSVFVQPGPAVVSTALCLSAVRGSTGDETLRAVITGYELAARVPRALGTRNLRRAGLANHGIGPVFGAAAAAATLARFSPDQVADTLSCCAQQASGSWQWLLDVAHVEKSLVFAGMGARNGLQAVLLVEAGYRGVPGSLDHPGGWWRAGPFDGGDADLAALTDGLDSPGALHDAAYKRYPVGGPTQPAVEALLGLVDDLDPDDIVAVHIAMPGRADAFRGAAMPALNLRYLSALILIDRRLDFEAAQSLERMHHDAAVNARMATVDVVHDPAQETGAGRDRAESARVAVTLRSGRRVERYVSHVRGFPTHPLDRGEVEDKARALMVPHLGPARVDEIVHACRELDRVERADVLVELIAR
jgi:2-methylcitrate dehydratase PrpD